MPLVMLVFKYCFEYCCEYINSI